jgi:hypothetical protein
MANRTILKTLLASTCLVVGLSVPQPVRAQAVANLMQPGFTQDVSACDAAGAAAETRYTLPSGLLRAIGRVESGRRDPSTGQVAPWPWAINAQGRGQLPGSREEALAATRALQQAGVASIDVGCFQVNLVHHPLAFPLLEDGFDPARNADYAARFLAGLRAKTGSWEAAVAAYHSATPELGEPYRDRVLAVWGHGAIPDAAPAVAVPLVVRVVTWTPPKPGGAAVMRIWTPSAAGQGASVIRITRG